MRPPARARARLVTPSSAATPLPQAGRDAQSDKLIRQMESSPCPHAFVCMSVFIFKVMQHGSAERGMRGGVGGGGRGTRVQCTDMVVSALRFRSSRRITFLNTCFHSAADFPPARSYFDPPPAPSLPSASLERRTIVVGALMMPWAVYLFSRTCTIFITVLPCSTRRI